METKHYLTITTMNLYKGCHLEKSFKDVEKFRAYMKRQAKKNHNKVKATMHYTAHEGFTHTHWSIFLGL